MTPQELKASILQLAIQGKLVPQIESEGNAEDLFKEIQKEKQRLIDEKKIKKEKPLEPIKEEDIPFDVPSSWKWCYLKNVCSKLTDGSHNPPPNSGKGYPVISAINVKNGEISLEVVGRFVNQEGFDKENPRTNIQKGDIIMGIIGGSIGNTAIYTLEDKVVAQRSIAIMTALAISNKYLFYFLQSSFVQYLLKKQSSGSAQGGVYLETLNAIYFPLPPLEEQKRIVAKIEELLPLVERYGKAYERLEEFNKKFPGDMKKSVLQMAIQGKLVEQRPEEGTAEELYELIQTEKARLIKEGKIKKEKPLEPIKEEDIPFDIPSSWKWVRLSSLGHTQTGNTPSKSHMEYFGNDIPFIGPGDLKDGAIDYENQGISFLGKEQARICGEGTIIQVCIGGSIGKSAITNREIAFNQQINSITPICSDSSYLYFVLSSKYFTDVMKSKAGGTATPIINRGLWDNLPIPLPPLEEQKRIVAKLEEVLPLCDALIK